MPDYGSKHTRNDITLDPVQSSDTKPSFPHYAVLHYILYIIPLQPPHPLVRFNCKVSEQTSYLSLKHTWTVRFCGKASCSSESQVIKVQTESDQPEALDLWWKNITTDTKGIRDCS
ncbi:hypothetical protein KQX54_019357 [Cotesia glomerata]|uniref:Uncharacterized protein n=1 Tax=Cotesia glomerata TaxID=32391 RepID=A0AAV7HZ92_COTGL|nr:hypothetical protein KQX54_019357 [Cotesia glomerata]